MGYVTFDIPHVNECGVKDNNLVIKLFSGKVVTYKTNLGFDIPPQRNLFNSKRVAFLLYHGEDVVIGRNDGTISIYDKHGLLIGARCWESPKLPPLSCAGYFINDIGKTKRAYVDTRDGVTVYRGDWIAVMPYPILEILNEESLRMSLACAEAKVLPAQHNCCIYTEGGEIIDPSEWFVHTLHKWSDNGIDSRFVH